MAYKIKYRAGTSARPQDARADRVVEAGAFEDAPPFIDFYEVGMRMSGGTIKAGGPVVLRVRADEVESIEQVAPNAG